MTTTMEQVKAERKARRKAARAQFHMPYQMSDILHHSWGYNQTNCDFYQVIYVGKHSVGLRKIQSEAVAGSAGFMSNAQFPVKDAFVYVGPHALSKHGQLTPEKPIITKVVNCYLEESGAIRYYIPTPSGYCSLWNGRPQYCSWYA